MRPALIRQTKWLAFFGAILVLWLALALAQLGPAAGLDRAGAPAFWDATGLARLADLCRLGVADARPIELFAMWALMSAAMMAPTALPAFAAFDDLTRSGAAGPLGLAALIAGFLAVWLGFSALAAAAQLQVAAAGLASPERAGPWLWANAGLLAGAGLYQFSALKDACLTSCRAPLAFFLTHWRPGALGAVAMGLRLGAVCVGCCWALMALGLAGGMASVAWMGLATLLMTLEKLPDLGRPITRPLGFALLTAAGVAAGGALVR